MTRRRA